MTFIVADAGVAFGFVLMIVLAFVVAVVGGIGLVLNLTYRLVRGMFRVLCGGPRRILESPRRDRGVHVPAISGKRAGSAACPTRASTDAKRGGRPIDHRLAGEGIVCGNLKCARENPPEAVYCGQCGMPLKGW